MAPSLAQRAKWIFHQRQERGWAGLECCLGNPENPEGRSLPSGRSKMKEKVCVVTGAGWGDGASLARRFAHQHPSAWTFEVDIRPHVEKW